MKRQNDLNINTDPQTKEEIAVAIKTLKSGKAAGSRWDPVRTFKGRPVISN